MTGSTGEPVPGTMAEPASGGTGEPALGSTGVRTPEDVRRILADQISAGRLRPESRDEAEVVGGRSEGLRSVWC